MSADDNIDRIGQLGTYCSNCYAPLVSPKNHSAGLQDRSTGTPPNQTNLPTSIVGVTATRDQPIPIWSPNLSASNDFQQQAVSTVYDGYDNGWSSDAYIAPYACDPASQGLVQSLSFAAPGLSQSFIPRLSSVNDYLVSSNDLANSQPDPTLQPPRLSFYNGFDVAPNGFANTNSSTLQDDSTAIDYQATMSDFNQLSSPTTTGIPATAESPPDGASLFTASAVPEPTAERMASRRSNVNANPYTCDHPGCGKTLTRRGDLVRHKQQHGPPKYPCPAPGCSRGLKAFHRADKLRVHQRKIHGPSKKGTERNGGNEA